MPDPALEISGASIVLIGAFNPRIFQPEWFARQSLLPQAEADDANVQIIHPQVTQFETERFIFQVTMDRLTAQSKPSSAAAPLRDLIVGTFYILEHTPVQAMGLNRQMHFAMHSEDAWHILGDKLAPKDVWSGILDRRPGLRNLEILYNPSSPKEPATTVKIQPSVQAQWGVFFEINNHFAADNNENGLKILMGILNDQWEELQHNAERIAKDVLDWAAA